MRHNKVPRTPRELTVCVLRNSPLPLAVIEPIFNRKYGSTISQVMGSYHQVSRRQILKLGEKVQRMVQDVEKIVEQQEKAKLPPGAVFIEILIGRGGEDPEVMTVTSTEVTLERV